MKTFYLREIAHARSGDKGDINNIGVIAYEPRYYPLLLQWVTPERVKAHFGSIVKGRVTRYELPKVHAINLVLEEALGGGERSSYSCSATRESARAALCSSSPRAPRPRTTRWC